MKLFLYLLSGCLFGIGLCLSGMIDPAKVKAFLALGVGEWNPSLVFVLGAAVPVYFLAFLFVRKRQKTLNGTSFLHPQPRPIDKKLVLGAVIFGAGWGLAGICPGPALVHLAFLDGNFLLFILAMVAGFELQRRVN